MGTAARWAVACVAAVSWAAPGRAQHPPAAPVSPTQEIEVLDPGVDPTGRPAAQVKMGPDGVNRVEVPPTVLVHRFYYTGDRNFQGPLLTGGPVIVAVSHPKTFERVYVPLVLPPGSPRVYYTRDAIRYDFGPQSITLTWGLCGNPQVRYGQATWVGDRSRGVAAGAAAGVKSWVHRTGVPEGIQKASAATKDALSATADRIKDVGQMAVTPVLNVARALPGAQLLNTPPEDRAARAREAADRVGLPATPDVTIPRRP